MSEIRWDYLFFGLFLYPILKWLYLYFVGKSDEARLKKKAYLDSLTREKRVIYSSSQSFIAVIPCFAAYLYADYRYLWLTLGIMYLLAGGAALIAALSSQYLKKYEPEIYEKAAQQSEQDLKHVNFWPKWQVHALCVFNVSILVFWFYSWRHLFF